MIVPISDVNRQNDVSLEVHVQQQRAKPPQVTGLSKRLHRPTLYRTFPYPILFGKVWNAVQLVQGRILVREKKRSRTRRTFRQVPIASSLAHILTDWLKLREGGHAIFLREWSTNRKQSLPEIEGGIIPSEAHNHLQYALRQSRWSIVPGWHVFRHSFISNCANRGVDQRIIDD